MSDNKVISLDRFRAKKNLEIKNQVVNGKLVWLYCASCDSIEYTNVIAPYGRSHKCGNQVAEDVVELDLRAEKTISQLNLSRIEELQQEKERGLKKIFNTARSSILKQLKKAENMYILKLEQAHGGKITPYEIDEEMISKLPIAEKDTLGIYVSHFKNNPTARFK